MIKALTIDSTYSYFLDLGEFDKNLPKEINVDLVVGQAHFIKCPKHTKGSNIIYKWGKSSDVSGTKFMESKENYIVLDSGTLFYSHLTQSDVKLFNENEWTCGMEGKVGDNNQFRWADNVKTVFNVKSSKYPRFFPSFLKTWKHPGANCQIEIQTIKFLIKYSLLCFQISWRLVMFFARQDYTKFQQVS